MIALLILGIALHYCGWLLYHHHRDILRELLRRERALRYLRHAARHRRLQYTYRALSGIEAQLAYIERTAGREPRSGHPP